MSARSTDVTSLPTVRSHQSQCGVRGHASLMDCGQLSGARITCMLVLWVAVHLQIKSQSHHKESMWKLEQWYVDLSWVTNCYYFFNQLKTT